MAQAATANCFVFNGQQTIADLLVVAATLERAGHRPSLRLVRYNDTPDSIAVDIDAPAAGEMAVAGEDLPDPATRIPDDEHVWFDGAESTWGELSQNERMNCVRNQFGVLVGGLPL